MIYDIWGKTKKERDSKQTYEKAFRRKGLPAWDEKWHRLSPAARVAYLEGVKGPVEPPSYGAQPNVAADGFAAGVLKELVDAGFVEVRVQKTKIKGGSRVFAVAAAYDFAVRVRALNKYRPLAATEGADTAKGLGRYIDYVFYSGAAYSTVASVLREAGVGEALGHEAAIVQYIVNYRWPSWVASGRKDPLADRLIAALRDAPAPVPIVELARRVGPGDAAKARAMLEELIIRLAAFEGLDPETHDIVGGLLPEVREAMILAERPRVRPPLDIREAPREHGPEGNLIVQDIRALLLEIAAEPPRLLGDRALDAKETERFLQALDPSPAWLETTLDLKINDRVEQAHEWAVLLKLVKESGSGKSVYLALSAKGEAWLSGALEDQYASILNILRAPPKNNEQYDPAAQFLYAPSDYFRGYGLDDSRFLGIDAVALAGSKKKGGQVPSAYREVKIEDVTNLRQALDRAFAAMKPGAFYVLKSVALHAVFGEHNPLRLGREPGEVTGRVEGQTIPPLEEFLELAAMVVLTAFVQERLIPLGGLKTAIDADSMVCVARTPLLDAYFGRHVPKSELVAVSSGESRVVVQPDFSVVIIGLNPAPAASLAPFCERSTRGGGQGAMVLKMTRESVVKAVANGLAPKEIVARLEAHASVPVPPNVLKEVAGWAAWVRRVTTSTLTVLRCPDRETADRVLGALKRQGERINDTLVALDVPKLTTVERAKLRDQGILVDSEATPAGLTKAPKKKRYY